MKIYIYIFSLKIKLFKLSSFKNKAEEDVVDLTV